MLISFHLLEKFGIFLIQKHTGQVFYSMIALNSLAIPVDRSSISSLLADFLSQVMFLEQNLGIT